MEVVLNIKTNYNLLSSLIKIDDVISYAKENKIKSLGIADTNMFATLEFYKKCINNDIKPLIGVEYFINDLSITCYAINYEGYKSLIKLTSILKDRELELKDIINNKNNLVVIIPFSSLSLYKELSNKIVNLYLGFKDAKEYKEELILTKNVIFFNDIRYIKKDDKELLNYLYLIRDNKTIKDNINYDIDNSIEDIISNKVSNDNLKYISDLCKIEFPKYELSLPEYKSNPHEYLEALSRKGLEKRLNNNVPTNYLERLKYELDVIKEMGFSNYFLVVYDYIKYAKKENILVGPGRGSGAGSLVTYSLGITEIDPIKYDLLFERFLNIERITMPDIDTDFPDIYRDKMIDYVEDKYGKDKVSLIITFGKFAGRSAIRDVSKVLDVDERKINLLIKLIPLMSKDTIKDIYSKTKEFKKYVDDDEEVRKVVKIASLLEGYPKYTGVHPSGVIISDKELDEIVPLTKVDNRLVSAYPGEELEHLGLLKMDFLAITNLTTISNILDMMKKDNIDLDFNSIDLNDKETLEIFSKGYTNGVFQFESSGMKNFLRRLKPKSFDEIIAAIALFRPGPSDNIDTYIKRCHGEEKVTYLDPSIEPILKSTYGILIYQEQIMQVANVVAGYSLGEADILRRAMGKKKLSILESEESKFINNAVERGYKKEVAKEIYDLILKFANYGFNKSHSVAYSYIAFKMAYLKCHYPKYFYSSLLTMTEGNTVKTKEIINELKDLNTNILLPDINLSNASFKVEKDGIRYGLAAINNVGSVGKLIEEKREGKYTSIFDFVSKVGTSITKKVLTSLNYAGALRSLGYNIHTIDNNMDAILNYLELSKDLDPSLILEPVIEEVEEYSKEELFEFERIPYNDLYISEFPTTKYVSKYKNIVYIKDLKNYFNKIVNNIIMIDSIKEITTKNNEEMAFINASDETGSMEYVLFPKIWDRYRNIKAKDILLVQGNVERRLDKYQIVINRLEKLNK